MEHIVQFAISIDDERIKDSVEKAAISSVVYDLRKDIDKNILDSWGNLREPIEDAIKECVDKYKDEILSQAINNVTESIKKSKKYREGLAKIAEEMEK